MTINLDDDPRPSEQQADEFFNRAGDFHNLDIVIPLDNTDTGTKLGANCIIKFTPEQKPLVIEILRQLRGALDARITLTPMHHTAVGPATGTPTDGRAEHFNYALDAPHLKPIPMSNGQTAYTITPPPPRDTSGRHRKPDQQPTINADAIHDAAYNGD